MNRTVKNTISMLVIICMIAILFSANAFASDKEEISYKSYIWSDEERLSAIITEENYFEVSQDTLTFESNEVYVVKGNVTVSERIECGQNVKLILTDDSTLDLAQGIHVMGSLDIYGNGTLHSVIAEHKSSFSNIGLNKGETSCDITIYGGLLDLRNEGQEPCINTGRGNFTQFDGKIDAYTLGDGIQAGSITIYGGEQNITSQHMAGITADTVTIYEGEHKYSGILGAGVEGKDITFNGGYTITKSRNGAGVGSGDNSRYGKSSCNSITINGGYVGAESISGASIGSGECGSCSNITINGGDVVCENTYGAAIGSGSGGKCNAVNINGGCVLNYTSHGYIFRGNAVRILSDGEMPTITLGDGVVLHYGQTSDDFADPQKVVTSASKDITKILKDERKILIIPDGYYASPYDNTGSVFFNASTTIIVGLSALIVGVVAGAFIGKKTGRRNGSN